MDELRKWLKYYACIKKKSQMALGIKNSWKYEKDLIHILNLNNKINAITRLSDLFIA